jgi:hypothetical protein
MLPERHSSSNHLIVLLLAGHECAQFVAVMILNRSDATLNDFVLTIHNVIRLIRTDHIGIVALE